MSGEAVMRKGVASQITTIRPAIIAMQSGGTTLFFSPETLTEAECEQLWIEEAESRYARFQAGETSAVDGDEAFARARARKLPPTQCR